jgi:hypothetical protein
MANKNTEVPLIEGLKIGESLEEVTSDSLKAAVSQAVEELIKDSVSEASAQILSAIAGSVGGVGAKVLVRMLLRISDSVSAKLNTICREPFETGMRVAQEALDLECKSDDEHRFREQQLMFSLGQLERAWTLLAGNNKTQLRPVVRLAEGICAAEIAGAANYALPRLLEWRNATLTEIEGLRRQMRDLERGIPALKEDWETSGKKLQNMMYATRRWGTPQQGAAGSVLGNVAAIKQNEMTNQIERLANRRSELERKLRALTTVTLVIENVMRDRR